MYPSVFSDFSQLGRHVDTDDTEAFLVFSFYEVACASVMH